MLLNQDLMYCELLCYKKPFLLQEGMKCLVSTASYGKDLDV